MQMENLEWRGCDFDYGHGVRIELWIPTKSQAPHLMGQKVGNYRLKQWAKPPTTRQRATFIKKAKADLLMWASKPL